jgi:tape measure domain-containing protein
MATELERLLVRIDATTETMRRELKRGEDSLNTFQRKSEQTTSVIEKRFKQIGAAGALYFGAQGIRQVIQYSDSFKQLEGRLNTVTGSTQKTAKAQADLLALSQKSGTSVAANTGLYVRLNQSLDATQKKQFDVLKITETVAKSFAITGESAGAMQGAVTQLAQAIASDFKASSQEINSLIDQAPRLAQVVAQELGLRVPAEMKKMAESGELSTDKFLSALQRGAATINAEYEQMGATVSRSLTRLDNAFLSYIGKSDAIASSTSTLSLSIDGLAENFEAIADVAVFAATAVGARYAGAAVMAGAQSIILARQLAAVQVALGVMEGRSVLAAKALVGVSGAATLASRGMALLGGPVGVAILAATAIYAFSDSSSEAQENLERLRVEMDDASKAADDLAVMNDKLAESTGQNKTKLEEESKALRDNAADRLESVKAKILDAEANVKLRQTELEFKAKIAAGTSNPLLKAFNLDAETETRGEYTKNIKALGELYQLQNKLNDALSGKGSGGGKAGGSAPKGGLADKMKTAKKAADELQKSLDEMQAAATYETVTMGMDEQAKAAYDVELELKKLEERYGTLTEAQKKQAAEIVKNVKANNAAKAAIKAQEETTAKLQEQAEENRRLMEEPYINAMKNIQNVITDTFEGVFDGSIDSAADAAGAIKKIFFRMAAGMATLQIFGAQGLNIAGMMGAGSAGGGFSLGNLSSIGSSAMNLFGGGDMLGMGLDKLGSAFGMGEILPWSGRAAAGTGLSSASSLTNGSFGGSLGGAAGGFAGNLGANAIFGQRGIGADIGGTVGAIAGSFIPVPILGPMIGSFIGNAIGGLFGNKKPSSRMQTGSTNLETGEILARGGLRGDKFSQENQDMVDALSGSAAAMAKLFNITDKLSIAVSQRYGFEFAKGTDLKVFDTDSPLRKQFKEAGDLLEALFKDFTENTTRKFSDAVSAALKNVDFSNVDQAISDIEFLKSFEEMINPISRFDAAMTELNKRFNPIIEQAKRLGLPLDRINQLYKEQKEALEAFEVQAKIAEIETVLTTTMNLQIEALNEQARAANEFVQRFSRIKESFTDFIQELTVGKFSPLAPVERLAAIRSQVEVLGAKAQLGDAGAAEELRQLLPAFLELSGEVNGFNMVYAQDRDRAEALSRATLSVFTRQVSIQEGIAQAAANQIQVLQDGFNRMVAALQTGRDVFTGGTSNAAGRNLNEVTSSGLTVGQTEAIYRSVTGYTGATGAGQLSAAAVGKESAIIAAMRAAGAKGFATGGLVTGGGGIDTIPAMLTSGEFVVNRAAASRIGMGALQSINSGGGSSLDGKMDSLIRITASLVKVTAESGNVNADMLAGVQGQLADMQRSQRLMAAG